MGRNTLGVFFWHYPIVLALWYSGATEWIVAFGDPLWKYLLIVIAALTAIVLSLSIFTLPLKMLEKLIGRVPVRICVIADTAAVIAAIILQLTVLS